MNKNFLIVFLLILGLPISTISWIGIKMAQDERALADLNYKRLLESRLDIQRERVALFLQNYEEVLGRDLSVLPADEVSLRASLHSSPYANQYFFTDKEGDLLFPGLDPKATSNKEKRFLERSGDMFERKLFSSKEASEEVTTFSKVAPNSIGGVKRGHWYSRFQGEGLQIFYFLPAQSNRIKGVEVNRIRILSDLVVFLSTGKIYAESAEANLVAALVDERGSHLGRWGVLDESAKYTTIAEVILPAPLDSWKFVYQLPSGTSAPHLGRSVMLNTLAALAFVIATLVVLGVYFYREHRRYIREAAKRVSFVNQVSHELKTPLTNIRMYAELLEDEMEEDNHTARGYLEVISQESQRLSRLIGNILTFARIEKKKFKLRTSPDDISEIIKDALSPFAPSLKELGIEVSLGCQCNGKRLLDRDIVHQIVCNLISNVEKYAAVGGSLAISCREEKGDLILEFADKGPGVPRKERERIFHPFSRGSDSLTEGVAGTGIGLTIARDLAKLHGGDLTLLESDVGAVFRLQVQAPKR